MKKDKFTERMTNKTMKLLEEPLKQLEKKQLEQLKKENKEKSYIIADLMFANKEDMEKISKLSKISIDNLLQYQKTGIIPK